jgi:hypothetical protein
MKTPRDILLSRHRAVEPKLDAIRHKVVDQLAVRRPAPSRFSIPDWLRVWWSWRWQLAGLTAVWLTIGLLHAGSPDATAPVVAHKNTVSRRQLEQAYQENQRKFFELLEPPSVEAAPAARPVVPPRRSESSITNRMV